MKNREIKVIKSGAEPALPPKPTTREIKIQLEKDEADDLREMTGNVKNWITERRENSIAEQKTAKIDRVAWNKKNKFIQGK